MYGCQIWTQKLSSISDKISILQKKTMRIMTFSEYRAHTEPLFKKLKILKFKDSITKLNCTFVHDYLKGNLPRSFNNIFQRVDEVHQKETSNATE